MVAGVVSVVDKHNDKMFDELARVAYRLLLGVVYEILILLCFLMRVWDDFLMSQILILRNFSTMNEDLELMDVPSFKRVWIR